MAHAHFGTYLYNNKKVRNRDGQQQHERRKKNDDDEE